MAGVAGAAAPAGPRAPTQRIAGVDVARALAIIGMLAVNVGPTDAPGPAGWLYALPHGRASLLFVLLAGVGVSLMAPPDAVRGDPRRVASTWATLLWRAALLLVGGLALQLLDHDVNVILPAYALLFVLAGLATYAPDGALLAGAGVVALVGPVVWLVSQGSALATGAGAPTLLDDPATVLQALVLSGPYPLVTWTAPFLLGLWLGRRDISDRVLQRRMVAVGATVALLAAAIAALATRAIGGPVEDVGPRRLLTSAAHGQMPLWLVGGTASAVLTLGACLLLVRDGRGWARPLVAAGQLALTIYVGHLLALHWLRPLPHDLSQGVIITVVMVLLATAGATAWRAAFSRGPLEVLLRAPRLLRP